MNHFDRIFRDAFVEKASHEALDQMAQVMGVHLPSDAADARAIMMRQLRRRGATVHDIAMALFDGVDDVVRVGVAQRTEETPVHGWRKLLFWRPARYREFMEFCVILERGGQASTLALVQAQAVIDSVRPAGTDVRAVVYVEAGGQ
jgi:hypothetical protein